MSSRSRRIRKSKQLADFDYGRDENSLSPIHDGEDAANYESFELPPKRARRTAALPLLDHIKMEPDESCVLPTDSVIEAAVRAKKSKSYSKVTLKSLSALDIIPLDILQTLSPNMLCDLFGKLKSDELTRQFVYECHLMPSRCTERFKSYGNEHKARTNMENHLLNHIAELVDDTAESNLKFTAESMQAKERRIDKMRARSRQPCVVLERLPKSAHKTKTTPKKKIRKKSAAADSGSARQLSAGSVVRQRSPKKSSAKGNRAVASELVAVDTEADIKQEMSGSASEIEIDDFEEGTAPLPPRNDMLLETESLINKSSEMIEKIQSQLRLERQPYKDHCYPVLVKGHIRYDDMKMEAPEPIDSRFKSQGYSLANKHQWNHSSDAEDEDVIHHDLACHYGIIGARLKTGYMVAKAGGAQVPIMQFLQIPKRQASAPAVGEEVCIMKTKPLALVQEAVQQGCIVDSDSEDEMPATTTLARPYPPMPKYQPELGTKLIIPEEEMNFPENEEDMPDEWDLDNPDHVKKYAVKCMRDLKQNKGLGARNCNVSCKICNREFTATATLMYHYRSHANIKPFCCLLCNATFTRQHSLNYHMLIHNDATRFKCPDCGRAFRHPSHYKEHRRRHTGEQPYHCPRCEMKFKTRNSYKRHIATKHPDEDLKLAMAMSRHIKPRRPTVEVDDGVVYAQPLRSVSQIALKASTGSQEAAAGDDVTAADTEEVTEKTASPDSSSTAHLDAADISDSTADAVAAADDATAETISDTTAAAIDDTNAAETDAVPISATTTAASADTTDLTSADVTLAVDSTAATPITVPTVTSPTAIAIVTSTTSASTTSAALYSTTGSVPTSTSAKPILLKMQEVKPAGIDLKQFTKVKLITGSSTKTGLLVPGNMSVKPAPGQMIAVPVGIGQSLRNQVPLKNAALFPARVPTPVNIVGPPKASFPTIQKIASGAIRLVQAPHQLVATSSNNKQPVILKVPAVQPASRANIITPIRFSSNIIAKPANVTPRSIAPAIQSAANRSKVPIVVDKFNRVSAPKVVAPQTVAKPSTTATSLPNVTVLPSATINSNFAADVEDINDPSLLCLDEALDA